MSNGHTPLGLRLPLQGLCLIEASAGTGKTFTLTAWLLRLLLERGLPLPQLLTVTFTRAATAELRLRIRRRLRIAQRLLVPEGHEADSSPPAAPNGEWQDTARILDHCRAQGMGDDTLRERLAGALLQLDQLQVFTIHAFAQQAVNEVAFLAGALDQRRLVDDLSAGWQRVAADLWRLDHQSGGAAWLRQHWDSPQALARQLPSLCDGTRALRPTPTQHLLAPALHALRDEARARMTVWMQQQGVAGFDHALLTLEAALGRAGVAAVLHARWPVVIVDEFQDTDPRQWRLFQAMHAAGSDGLLGLIGDPKQAIYGFRGGDLPTYLAARAQARREGEVLSLTVNHRSSPSLLKAVSRLYAGRADAFGKADIQFVEMQAPADAADAALRLAGQPSAALHLHWLPLAEDGEKKRNNAELQRLATHVVALRICELLDHGRWGADDGAPAVRASDIAVLVRTSRQLEAMRAALINAGISVSSQSRSSVYASRASDALLAVFEALLAPGDPSRLRGALASPLFAFTASALAAFETDEPSLNAQQRLFEQARHLWDARGPLPAVLQLLTDSVQTRLRETGGERLLIDTLHLLELLQAQAPLVHGARGLLQWLRRQRAQSGEGETNSLRAEGELDAVQLLTLHQSKGLEWPVVFLPFAAFRPSGPAVGGAPALRHGVDRGDGTAFLHVDLGGDDAAGDIKQAQAEAETAEDARLLYVGLTRAREQLHVVHAFTNEANSAPLTRLLHDGQPISAAKRLPKGSLHAAHMRPMLDALVDDLALIQIHDVDAALGLPPQRIPQTAHGTPVPRARTAQRRLRSGAGQHSFSSLHRHAAATPRAAGDERASMLLEGEDALGGTGLGTAVHNVLEAADFSAWAHDPPPETELARVRDALRREGLPGTAAAQQLVARLTGNALRQPLPLLGPLHAVAGSHRLAEMEFHFRLRGASTQDIQQLLQSHGYVRAHPLAAARLEGAMHGFIDLVVRDASDRFHVIDYKTNRLAAYDAPGCAAAIRANDYDLQYLIYLVALRRWLALRLGSAAQAQAHLGGALYLFLRGMTQAHEGVHHDPVAPALIAELDQLLDGGMA